MQETNKKVNSCNGECSGCESASSCSVNNFQLKLNEYSHIKIFIPLGVSVNDNDAEKAVSRVNEINVETYGYETVLLENNYYFIKTIPLVFDLKADDLINIIKQAEKKVEEVVGKIF